MLQQKPLTHTPVSNTNKPIWSSAYHGSLSELNRYLCTIGQRKVSHNTRPDKNPCRPDFVINLGYSSSLKILRSQHYPKNCLEAMANSGVLSTLGSQVVVSFPMKENRGLREIRDLEYGVVNVESPLSFRKAVEGK